MDQFFNMVQENMKKKDAVEIDKFCLLRKCVGILQ